MQPKVLIYQMYPRVWDGFGAMTEHLQYVQALGVDYVWLSPCYPSGGVDGGYDVTDYCAIDPAIGTMEEFDEFVAAAATRGIKVLLDLVLNHTSTQHPWFEKSRQNLEPWADYYLWSEDDLGWNNMFDGTPAFKKDATRGEYYLHLFHETQADLNWRCPKVRNEFHKIVDFWTKEHHVAGFRLDVPTLIAKHMSSTMVPRRFGRAAGLTHYYMRREMLGVFHELFDGRDLFLVAESGAPFDWMFNRLFHEPEPVITCAFNTLLPEFIDHSFGLIVNGRDYARFERVLRKWSKNPRLAVAVESHDLPRFTSRSEWNGEQILETIVQANPRIICIYQGQELGLKNPTLSLDIAKHHDIQTIMRYYSSPHDSVAERRALMQKLCAESRDNARQPLSPLEYQWQVDDESSCFHFYCEVLRAWKQVN